jgi:hypothetical protein
MLLGQVSPVNCPPGGWVKPTGVSSRFISNLAVAILGAALVTMSLTFGPTTVSWLALGVGCAVVLIVLGAFAASGRGPLQRLLDITIVLVAVWMLTAARVFPISSVRWLCFSAACALCLLALTGLVAHEVIVERAPRHVVTEGASNGRHPELGAELADRMSAQAR